MRPATSPPATPSSLRSPPPTPSVRLGKQSRGQAHQEAAALLATIRPNGAKLARDLTAVLAVKDPAHSGTVFLAATTVKSVLRAARRLVEAAEDTLAGA